MELSSQAFAGCLDIVKSDDLLNTIRDEHVAMLVCEYSIYLSASQCTQCMLTLVGFSWKQEAESICPSIWSLKSMWCDLQVRFANVVIPGDLLCTRLWRIGQDQVAFQVKNVTRDTVAITNGKAMFSRQASKL